MARSTIQPAFDLPAIPDEIQATLDRLACELDELRQRDELLLASFNRLEEQLTLASQVQRDLLPNPMPAIAGLKVHALYLPCDHVSGDIYDVVRVDETHAAISLADASGHGMPAALMTVFVKRAFRAKDISNGEYRIVPPVEVLERLNRDLLETGLPDCRFVTGLHAVYDQRARCMSWARGGLPFPILVRDGRPAPVVSRGMLLGALEEVSFEAVQMDLRRGDTLMFYTDGLEALLGDPGAATGPAPLCETSWYQSLGRQPIEDLLGEVAERRRRISPAHRHLDDITVVAVEATE